MKGMTSGNTEQPEPNIVAVRHGTTAVWRTTTLVLAPGEFGLDTDLGIMKMGDGRRLWPELQVWGMPTNPDTGRPEPQDPWPDLTIMAEAAER